MEGVCVCVEQAKLYAMTSQFPSVRDIPDVLQEQAGVDSFTFWSRRGLLSQLQRREIQDLQAVKQDLRIDGYLSVNLDRFNLL